MEQSLKEQYQEDTRKILTRALVVLNSIRYRQEKNFDVVMTQFLVLLSRISKFKSNNGLVGRNILLAQLIAKKACTDPDLSHLYAKLIKDLPTELGFADQRPIAMQLQSDILDQVEQEFMCGLSKLDLVQGQSGLESNEKKKRLGLVKFVGELFKCQLFTPNFMIQCLQLLRGNVNDGSYECLCQLLTTAGDTLESALEDLEIQVRYAKSQHWPMPEFIPDRNYMANLYQELYDKIGTDCKLAPGIKHLLLDVIHRRQDKWASMENGRSIRDVAAVETREILRDLSPEKFNAVRNNFRALLAKLGPGSKSGVIDPIANELYEHAIVDEEYTSLVLIARLLRDVMGPQEILAQQVRTEVVSKCQLQFQVVVDGTFEAELEQKKRVLQDVRIGTEEKTLLELELLDYKLRIKDKCYRNALFVGELYLFDQLSLQKVVDHIQKLLGANKEMCYQYLSRFLAVVGPVLACALMDEESRMRQIRAHRLTLPPRIVEDDFMNKTFKKLGELAKNGRLSLETREMLQEVIQLRENYWLPKAANSTCLAL